MDGELLRSLYHHLFHPPGWAPPRPPAGCHYADQAVAWVYCVGAAAGRSTRWACDRRNWPVWARRCVRAPCYQQVMKRLRTDRVSRLVARLVSEFGARVRSAAPAPPASPGSRSQSPAPPPEKVVDGKPLVVGGYTKDPDARRGKVPGGWARGYKLHAVVDAATGVIDAFRVTALDGGEATQARIMLESGCVHLVGHVLRGDANYDSNRLYGRAAALGGRHVAPRRKPGTGLGHHPQHPHRLDAIAELESAPDAAKNHKRHRIRVEQVFGHLGNMPCGLFALPNSVRRLHRVTLFVTAKVALYHLYLATAPSRTAVAA